MNDKSLGLSSGCSTEATSVESISRDMNSVSYAEIQRVENVNMIMFNNNLKNIC